MVPPRYFLSYNRKDLDDVIVIAKTLMLHGINIWQDINNLGVGLAENKIREAIQKECSGLVFYATTLSIESHMVRDVELPEAERKHKSEGSFNIVPIFQLGIEETKNALRDRLTIPISNFNGVKMDGDKANILLASQEAAVKILSTINFNKNSPVLIGVSSKQKQSNQVMLDIDLMPYFANGIPTSGIWNKEIIPALLNLKDSLVQKKINHLRLYSFAHLSVGVLFGYVFRQRTGFTLEIEQVGKGERHIWKTNMAAEENPLKINVSPGELNSKNLCVKINLMANDDQSITSYCKKENLSYRAFVDLTPPTLPFFISNDQAVSIANDLADKIKKYHAEFGTNTVHLFVAVPLGLALLIGYNLNACGMVQCYEFDNATREYTTSCVLTSKY